MRLASMFSLMVAFAAVAGASGQLMCPDSTSDRVFLFDANDGTLLDDSYIDGSGILSTPICAITVGDETWISDQLGDTVYRFDADGNFIAALIDTGLDNVRGIEIKDDRLYVSNAGTANGAPDDAIVVFDLDGNQLDVWTGLGDPFDILLRSDDFLVNDIGTSDKISSVDFDGNLISQFAAGFAFPEQMTQRANGNILLATFSAPAGIYEFDADGNQLNYWPVGTGLRGVHELGNGNILWSNGTGAHVLDPNTGESTQVASGSLRFFEPVGGSGGPTCQYLIKKSKSKKGCEACPEVGSLYDTSVDCEVVKDCVKKVKAVLACPDGGSGTCKVKGKRSECS